MQTLFKHRKPLIIFAVIIFAFVWIVMVADVNKRLPDAGYEEYSAGNAAVYNGLSISPERNFIYSWDEFRENYPDSHNYDDWKHSEEDRLVVYQLKIKNIISDDIMFYPVYMRMFDENSCFGNGVTTLENGANSIILSASEEAQVKVAAYISAARIKKDKMMELKNENLKLALSYYPTNIVLSFCGEQDEVSEG